MSIILAHGVFRFANYYQDHMVLQRAPQRAIVWGYVNDSSASISLTMNNKVYYAVRSKSSVNYRDTSIWSVTLDAQTEEGPFQIKVNNTLANGTVQTITLDDILFGDIWICSGQSNMHFSVSEMFNASIEIQNANNYPKIRLFTVADTPAFTPQEEVINIGMKWSVASNMTLSNGYVSAVCWLYGRMIQDSIGERPMGLIHTSWGGTNIEYWTPSEVLKDCGVSE